MKVLVTGAFGFIGRHLVATLLDAGHQIHGLDHGVRPLDWPEEVSTWSKAAGAIENERSWEPFLQSFDACVHLAAVSNLEDATNEPAKTYLVNTIATERLAWDWQVWRPGRPFIFASTAAVYGPARLGSRALVTLPEIFRESDPCAPIHPYGLSKLAAENILSIIEQRRGLNWLAFRFFNAAGAWPDKGIGECHNPETHLIPRVIDACKAGEKISVYGTDWPTPDGSAIRDYVHVRDICDAIVLGLEYLNHPTHSYNRIMNLGGSTASVFEVIHEVERQLGVSANYTHNERRKGDVARLIADSTRAGELLGWNPTRSLQQIIKDAIRFRRG